MSVCFRCQRRTMTCHSNCPDYAAERADGDRQIRERAVVRMSTEIILDGVAKQKKEGKKGWEKPNT